MSYTPYTWQRGDVITSEKLNHIEDGIDAAEPLIVTQSVDGSGNTVLSHTWQEIYNAAYNGYSVFLKWTQNIEHDNVYIAPIARVLEDSYEVSFMLYDFGNSNIAVNYFYADTANGYPYQEPSPSPGPGPGPGTGGVE